MKACGTEIAICASNYIKIMKNKLIHFATALIILGCGSSLAKQEGSHSSNLASELSANLIDESGNTVHSRFKLPAGFQRVKCDSNSFAGYLRQLPLKPNGSSVLYFNGSPKPNPGIYDAVVDMEISKRDLQQCADAVMRLRAEHLYSIEEYDKIHFNFISDGKPRYYQNYAEGDYSRTKFTKYLNYIFAYANTASLHDELVPVPNIRNMQIGDVLIQKGNPYGHAVIVVDMAKHQETGQKIFMLAQSYMPAQETQVLKNPGSHTISPWYHLNDQEIVTPEWRFEPSDLRRFAN